MPSTTSSSLLRDLPSSTVMTPSLPTRSMASAINSPMDSSPLAEMVPTWAMPLRSVQGWAWDLRASTAAVTAKSIPRLRSMGFMPAVTALIPSRSMDWASTVAVVVPSPATSEVLDATCLSIWAPMFWNLSLSSISLATDTPSLVTVGAPQDFSSTTLRPRGPRVTLTALPRILAPCTIRSRARPENSTFLAVICIHLLNQKSTETGHKCRANIGLSGARTTPPPMKDGN